jgi:hypothetical protein
MSHRTADYKNVSSAAEMADPNSFTSPRANTPAYFGEDAPNR